MSAPPLVAHVIHRLGIGGLENGLVNLINHLPEDAYRHAVVCMTEATEYRRRIRRDDVTIVELHKRPGKDPGILYRLWRVFRKLGPALVHSRNLAALEAQLPAALAGVRVRVHGEHGRDIYDLHGENRKYLLLRKAMRPLVSRWVPMSLDLADWLVQRVGVAETRLTQIYNGVDVERFKPDPRARDRWPVEEMRSRDLCLVGAVGRMEAVKDPLNLVRAFASLVENTPAELSQKLRLAYLGDGPLLAEARALVRSLGLEQRCWLPGARDDIPALMPALDVFALPSLGEGISNTILEAQACGLPVVATEVGGNPELVDPCCGLLVPSSDSEAMAQALARYAREPGLRADHGRRARARIETDFSLPVMVGKYHSLYSDLLAPG